MLYNFWYRFIMNRFDKYMTQYIADDIVKAEIVISL